MRWMIMELNINIFKPQRTQRNVLFYLVNRRVLLTHNANKGVEVEILIRFFFGSVEIFFDA